MLLVPKSNIYSFKQSSARLSVKNEVLCILRVFFCKALPILVRSFVEINSADWK